MLLAYLLFKYLYIFFYSNFSVSSSAITFTALPLYLLLGNIFILLKMAVAFFIVSIEIASRWRMILSVKRDWPNHWIYD
jgi:hypothetical protein